MGVRTGERRGNTLRQSFCGDALYLGVVQVCQLRQVQRWVIANCAEPLPQTSKRLPAMGCRTPDARSNLCQRGSSGTLPPCLVDGLSPHVGQLDGCVELPNVLWWGSLARGNIKHNRGEHSGRPSVTQTGCLFR